MSKSDIAVAIGAFLFGAVVFVGLISATDGIVTGGKSGPDFCEEVGATTCAVVDQGEFYVIDAPGAGYVVFVREGHVVAVQRVK